jgi:hypothetical protein
MAGLYLNKRSSGEKRVYLKLLVCTIKKLRIISYYVYFCGMKSVKLWQENPANNNPISSGNLDCRKSARYDPLSSWQAAVELGNGLKMVSLSVKSPGSIQRYYFFNAILILVSKFYLTIEIIFF